jgi:hypothetical protein
VVVGDVVAVEHPAAGVRSLFGGPQIEHGAKTLRTQPFTVRGVRRGDVVAAEHHARPHGAARDRDAAEVAEVDERAERQLGSLRPAHPLILR